LITITNQSRGKILARRGKAAVGFLSRLKGLLFKPGLPSGEALIIPGCKGIHTFGMSFPIDVLFLGDKGAVLKAESSVKPWRFTFSFRGKNVVELPAGAIFQSGTQIGDSLLLKEN
jgi:hypothetical protein